MPSAMLTLRWLESFGGHCPGEVSDEPASLAVLYVQQRLATVAEPEYIAERRRMRRSRVAVDNRAVLYSAR